MQRFSNKFIYILLLRMSVANKRIKILNNL